jgi:SAM-dependent methyltransferase
MSDVKIDPDERARREQEAYDEQRVWEHHHGWHQRVHHVLENPNTQRAEEAFEALIAEALRGGGRALDVGCAGGSSSKRAIDLGASYVFGFDVAESMVAEARELFEEPGRLEFAVQDAQRPIDGVYDLIFGRSVLHHVDFREFLRRAYDDNLARGGRMVWMEPLSHPFTVAFHKLVRSAHTPDERPLTPADLRWMADELPGFALRPVNLLSFPAGIASTYLFDSADNGLTRLADDADRALERRPRLRPFFRQGLISVDKPA